MASRNCLITGASAGIGREFAYLMAERGYDLILVARREERLREIATEVAEKWGAKTLIIIQDLHKPYAADNILNIVAENNLTIDALINNAGYGLPGTFLTTKWQEQQDFLQIMLNTPTELCHKVLSGMKERGFGRIINIASLAGHLPGSLGHTLYTPVKAYMIKMSQSLNLECQGTGIHVTALCPGFTYSEFHDVNGTRELVSKMPKFMWLDADVVAELGFKALEENRAVYVTGKSNKAIAAMFKLLPDRVAEYFVKKNSDKFRKI
ncbi:SDR family NAD(P)-dependent oxidoreductase [Pseudaquidulcibacter saccharophilus]|uniref:SDR family NAD(P)-dependent oxidoreductase n=1 Tax=Pseudaquidulcibacter saccharophilus TaxID=2831900 RepID=UPI001EFF053B|nr:SDR family oxidoreductase [Pseudaquidulcibacter saccharophilus]